MAAALKPNTQRTYSSAQTRFINFCSKYNLVVMPVSENTLLLYIAFLFDEGLKGSSIKVYISAVRSLHIYSGFIYPSDMLRVRLAL
jgi:site-specific recombinase XerD